MRGLTGFQLKIIGIVLMTIDHIYQYFGFLGVPVYFNWLGRVVAPIFIFMAVEGYGHTRSVSRYLKRLYMASLLMGVGNIVLSSTIERPDMTLIPNNIFASIFLTVLYIHAFELIKVGIGEKRFKKLKKGALMALVPLLSGAISVTIWSIGNYDGLELAISTIFPNPFTSEGGIFLLVIGLLIYYARGNKYKIIARHSMMSVLTIDYGNITGRGLFYENYQWMMIFAGLFIYLYNGERGPGSKYLFYLYYPLHIYIFYILSTWIMVQL